MEFGRSRKHFVADHTSVRPSRPSAGPSAPLRPAIGWAVLTVRPSLDRPSQFAAYDVHRKMPRIPSGMNMSGLHRMELVNN